MPDRHSDPHDLVVRRPAWLVPVSLVLALLGLAVSAYLTYEHVTASATLACPAGETFNCERVTNSEWSYLLGIPVALLGLLYYVAVLAMCLPQVWRRPDPRLDSLRLGFLVAGLVFVLYLVWAELFKIHSICLWCTAVHILTFVLLAVVWFGQILSERVRQTAA